MAAILLSDLNMHTQAHFGRGLQWTAYLATTWFSPPQKHNAF
jgi:hypothetical protein